jgi:ectoine hydroxylase-related dioxygenase (phytanoyl-CoA dioxygenase family)
LATCSVWIALDDSTPENGCMRYIPASHRRRQLFKHELSDRTDLVLNQVLAPSEFDERMAEDVVLEAGQMSMHDIYLIHGSNPNRSGKRRAGYVVRIMPSNSHYDRAQQIAQSSNIGVSDFARRPIWLVRGVDRCGRNDFSIGHIEPASPAH